MQSNQEARRWVFFFAMLLFWFATLGIFAHCTTPSDFAGVCVGATVISVIAGFCLFISFVED